MHISAKRSGVHVLTLLLLSLLTLSCAGTDTSASKNDKASASSTPPISNSNDVNANTFQFPPSEQEKIDPARRQELEANNENFKVVPEEFQNVDFANFTYPNLSSIEYRQGRSIKLKNGELVYEDKEHSGGTTYSLGDVYYIDLAGDETKEALVMLDAVSCGGSCDGGSLTIYFYAVGKGKPKLLDTIGTGSRAYECSLKTLVIENKKIYVEQFGRCQQNGDNGSSLSASSCKFCIKDLTHTVYAFRGSKLVGVSSEVTETPQTNVMNYTSEISINE